MAMLNDGEDYSIPEAEQAHNEEEEEGASSVVEDEDEDPPASVPKRRPGRPPTQKQTAPAKAAKPPKRATQPAVEAEEEEEEEEEEEDEEDEEGEDEQEPTPKPQNPTSGRRGRPQKAVKAAAASTLPPSRGAKKRRSLDEEEAAGRSPEPEPKRARTTDKPAPKKATAVARKTTPEPAAKPKPRGRRRKSSIDDAGAGDVSQVAAARRPPLPKSRGLLINRRREVPGGPGSTMLRTRSGRTSFKPLAYWRNERVEFDKDEAEDAFVGRKHKGRFVLPSVKEVYRVDEPEPEVRARSSRRGGAGKKSSKRRGGGRRRSSGFEDDDDDEPAEVWELDPGTVTGEVVVWQPEYEFHPPAPNDLVSVMDKQLAISGAAIKTTEVVGGEFRYAKVFSEGFIGAGVVDLPPGAVKRLKNSRKVFMIFFVHLGRVQVTVQETSFRISKGGIFIVPRCKSLHFAVLCRS